MSVKDFLQSVLPDEGYLIVATLAPTPDGKRKVWWNNVVNDIAEVQVKARSWVNEAKDVYIALASYAEREVFNPKKKNYKTGQMGAMEKRTHANAKFLRSFFGDLDVKPEKPDECYISQQEALHGLRDFCRAVNLPKPTLVNSGYGLHFYWPLGENIPKEEWQQVADKLKDVMLIAGLKADPSVTADAARVLRIPGTKNFKRAQPMPVEVIWQAEFPYQIEQINLALDTYLVGKTLPKTAKKPSTGLSATPAPASVLGNNLGATNDPVNGNALVFRCAQIQKLVADRGASAPYPVWWLGLGVSRFTTDPTTFSVAISDGHSDYDPAETQAKAQSWTGGPPTCAKFWTTDNATCEACPMWRKITTPIELGRPWKEDQPSPPPPPVDSSSTMLKVLPPPPPPAPYVRVPQDDGSTQIFLRTMDEDETPVNELVCPYDLYPSRIMEEISEEEKDTDECSTWIVHQPRQRTKVFKMPQAMLSDTKKLHGFLLSRGLHINSKEAKRIQFYMTAYLKELAKLSDRERMFDRLGWHDEYASFAFPDVVYHKDGTVSPHVSSKEIDSITKGGMKVKGTVEGWCDAVRFYGGPTNYEYRAGLYSGWGAPLYGMTGQKGVLIAFSGASGQGKTTLMETIASMYADPDALLIGGGKHGATTNAMYSITGTYHSFPVLWDDTTDRSAEDVGEFMLHISNGGGKERMKGNKHDGRVVSWRTMVISSANTDDINRIVATNKDPEARLMRYVAIPFNGSARSTESKISADEFKRKLKENYGLVGRTYIKYIVEHAEEVRDYVHRTMAKFDRALKIKSQERHWSAVLACQYVGGRIAFKLGLCPFDPKDDIEWLKANIGDMRVSYADAAQTPAEMITEFLETRLGNTLILQAKGSNNIDNIVQRPHGNGGLQIRRENDTGLIYVARSALNAWCEETKANYKTLEAALVLEGIITRKSCHKVLGADTTLAGGQTRCVEISRDKLEKSTGGKK